MAAERTYIVIAAQVKVKKKKAYKIRLKMEATKWKAVHSEEFTQSSHPPIWTNDDADSHNLYSIIHSEKNNSTIVLVTGKAAHENMNIHSQHKLLKKVKGNPEQGNINENKANDRILSKNVEEAE